MDRYQRVEQPRDEKPIKENEVRVTAQGVVKNYINYALSLLQERQLNEIVLKAMGQAINKAVVVAEIVKKRIPRLHQDVSISSVSFTDVWEPIEEGLIPLETTRQVSMISISLSLVELDRKSPGYQEPAQTKPWKQQQYYNRQPRQSQGQYNDAVNEVDSYGRGRGGGRGRGHEQGGGGRGRGRGREQGRGRGGYGAYEDYNGGYSIRGHGGDYNGVYSNRGHGGDYNGGYSNRGHGGDDYDGGYSNRGRGGDYYGGGYSNRGRGGDYYGGGYSNQGRGGGRGRSWGSNGGQGRNWGDRGAGYGGQGGGGRGGGRGYGRGYGRTGGRFRGGGGGGVGGGSTRRWSDQIPD